MLYLQNLENAWEKNQAAGSVLIALGSAAVISSIVLGALHVRTKHKLAKLKETQVTVLPAIGKEESSLVLAITF